VVLNQMAKGEGTREKTGAAAALKRTRSPGGKRKSALESITRTQGNLDRLSVRPICQNERSGPERWRALRSVHTSVELSWGYGFPVERGKIFWNVAWRKAKLEMGPSVCQ